MPIISQSEVCLTVYCSSVAAYRFVLPPTKLLILSFLPGNAQIIHCNHDIHACLNSLTYVLIHYVTLCVCVPVSVQLLSSPVEGFLRMKLRTWSRMQRNTPMKINKGKTQLSLLTMLRVSSMMWNQKWRSLKTSFLLTRCVCCSVLLSTTKLLLVPCR